MKEKVQIFDDDRARRSFNVFPTPGQINFSVIYPGVTVAWHKHNKQDDYWFCVKGSIKVGLYDEKEVKWVYLNDSERSVLKIDKGLWHGYKNISNQESILCYYTTEKYDPSNPDEIRGEFPKIKWETETK